MRCWRAGLNPAFLLAGLVGPFDSHPLPPVQYSAIHCQGQFLSQSHNPTDRPIHLLKRLQETDSVPIKYSCQKCVSVRLIYLSMTSLHVPVKLNAKQAVGALTRALEVTEVPSTRRILQEAIDNLSK